MITTHYSMVQNGGVMFCQHRRWLPNFQPSLVLKYFLTYQITIIRNEASVSSDKIANVCPLIKKYFANVGLIIKQINIDFRCIQHTTNSMYLYWTS